MTELLLIPVVIWCILVTWAVGNLYTRPSGLNPDDIDLIKTFMDNVRRLAATEKRKAAKK